MDLTKISPKISRSNQQLHYIQMFRRRINRLKTVEHWSEFLAGLDFEMAGKSMSDEAVWYLYKSYNDYLRTFSITDEDFISYGSQIDDLHYNRTDVDDQILH